MRRRTADFLQGETYCGLPLEQLLTLNKSSTVLGRKTRRKKGKQQAGELSGSRDDVTCCQVVIRTSSQNCKHNTANLSLVTNHFVCRSDDGLMQGEKSSGLLSPVGVNFMIKRGALE